MASQSTQSSSTNLSFKALTINDLPLLCNALNLVASKCFALGLQLGVQYPQISAIEQNYRRSEDQLREIISERLKQDTPLTWHDIVTALRSPTVGENGLARQIECIYMCNLQPFASVAPQVSTVSSVPPTSSSLMLGEDLLPVRGSFGGEHSMTHQQMGPQHRGNYQQMIGQVRGPQHRRNYQPPTQMRGQKRGPPAHGENYHPPTSMLDQVRGPQHRGNYMPPTQLIGQVRRPPHGENHRPPTPMLGQVRGPQFRGNYQPPTQMIGQVRGPQHGEKYHLPTTMLNQVRGPQNRENYHPPKQMMSQVREPPHRENYHPPAPMLGQVRGPPHRANYQPPTQMMGPVRGPVQGENYQPPTQMMGQVRGPQHGENYQAPTPMLGQVRGSPHGENYQPPTQMMDQMPVRGASHGEPSTQMMGQTFVRGAPHGENYQPSTQMMGQTFVRGAPHGEYYQPRTQMMGQLTVRGPSFEKNYQPPTPYPSFSQAWESPGRVFHGTPQYDTHPLKYAPYIDIIEQHSDVLRETISGDLTFFINKFIELGIVTRTATDEILSHHGAGNGEKARQLLSLLNAHYNRKPNKKKWFDKFIGMFSSEPAYKDLANRMTIASEKMRWSDFGSSVTEPLPQISPFKSPMDTFVHYIKIGYKQCEIEKNLNVVKWPPTPSKIFINLACIDWKSVVSKEEADEYTRAMVEDGNVDVIMKKTNNIDFDDIVRDLPVTALQKVVLVEGAPGVGKSTFAWEFCRRWERGEIAQQYQLVLLLRLRDQRMSRAKSLRDLIYHYSESVCHAVVDELQSTLGVNTLIILEGFDELPDFQRKDPSIFLQLILGQILLHATIMITSRPWATGALLAQFTHRIFLHIKILGFTEKSITKYVTSVFTGEGKKTASAIEQSVGGPGEVSEEVKKNIDDVMAYIGKYPQIKACMYIPLNAAIVVSIYRESMKSKWLLPATLTELYCSLTQILLLRHLRGHAEYSHQLKVKSFEDLPKEVYSQLLVISKIAYDGVCREGGKSVQLIFPDIPDDFETLGLMQSISQLFMDGQKTSHNFLNLTFQEFLAAFLISTMSSVKQLEHFQRHKDGRMRVVLRFLAGLTKHVPLSSTFEITPLIIKFTDDRVPLGCFERTISCLLLTYEQRDSRSEDNSKERFPRNVASLFCPTHALLLVNSSDHIEVYNDADKYVLPEVRENILGAIRKVLDSMHLTEIDVSPAVLCPCKKVSQPHPASLREVESELFICCSKTKLNEGTADEKHIMWFGDNILGKFI